MSKNCSPKKEKDCHVDDAPPKVDGVQSRPHWGDLPHSPAYSLAPLAGEGAETPEGCHEGRSGCPEGGSGLLNNIVKYLLRGILLSCIISSGGVSIAAPHDEIAAVGHDKVGLDEVNG